MDTFGAAYRELVLGGHLLAIGTSSMAAASTIMLGMRPTFVLLVMAYLFSYGAYMMNRVSDMEQDEFSNPLRTNHLRSRRKYLPAIVGVCFGLGYALAFSVNFVFFLTLFVPLLLSVAYSVGSKKLVPLLGASKLKQQLLVKNLAISFGWSLIPLLVGLYYSKLDGPLVLLIPFIVLRLMPNTILFDARDVAVDSKYGVRTIPSVYGLPSAFRWMNIADVFSALYLLAAVATRLFSPYALSFLALPVYSLAYRRLVLSGRLNMNFICDFVADGEYVLWGPLLYLGKIFL